MILFTLVLSTLLTSIWCAPATMLRRSCAASALTPSCVIRFYFSRGFNCCAELRTILECDPVGECMGFLGDCGDMQAQFAGVQGSYIYGDPPEQHQYIDDYICTQFPDDAYVTDQILVGLISVAVALPVDIFLARAFELANEGDEPLCWLDAPSGKWRLLLGKDAHNEWRLADPKQPVSDMLLWTVRYSSFEPLLSSLWRAMRWLWRKARATVFGPEPEAEEEDDSASAASREARAHALTKRLYASFGLLGVYTCWTIMSWCVLPMRMHICDAAADAPAPLPLL
jgi:hypothetical protein